MSAARRRARRRRGFTLVESLATIVALSIVAGVSSGIIVQATDGYVEASTRAQLHAEASAALDRAVRELRNIALDATVETAAPDVDTLLSTYIDWEGDNRLSFSGGELLLKLDGGASDTLLTDVTAFEIVAFDESDTQLGFMLSGAGCDPIRRLRLTVTVSRYGVSTTLRTRVFLRSTMSAAEA